MIKKNVALLLASVLMLTGCGIPKEKTEIQTDIVSDESVQDEVIDDTTDKEVIVEEIVEGPDCTVIEEVSTATNEQAAQAYKELVEQALVFYKNGNVTSLQNLCRGNAENMVQKMSEFCACIEENAYPDYEFYTIVGNGTYFITGLLNSYTTGTYPDTNSLHFHAYWPISYIDGVWKFDESEDCSQVISEISMDMYPENFVEAVNAGSNCVDFSNSDYSWVDSDVTIRGTVDSRIYLAWQNDDGSVSILFNVKNGTDEIRSINEITLTLEDEALGTILKQTYSGDALAPGSAQTYQVTVSADNIYTGTSSWGNVHSSCDSSHH